jgi:serine/threonine-protein kinase
LKERRFGWQYDAWTAMNAELAPDSVLSGTYRVVRTIGRGGMGEVYEVRHLRTKAPLALKVLMADSRMPQQLFQRFRREAEITSNLNHPNIVRVFDFDNLPDGRPFLVMELLEGRELTRLLEPGKPLPPAEVVAIVQQIAQGLSAAHERGIVHRDLKPGNIFMMTMPGGGRELVKLLDFGISKVRGGVSNLTRTDTIMGTPHYMSPEQASGRTDEADGRTDQFALASITYEMLSGRMAFPGDAAPSVLYRVVHEQPPKLRSWVAELPSTLENVVNRGLAKRPDDRFATVTAFTEALAQAAEGIGRAKAGAAPRPARPHLDAVAGALAPQSTTLRFSAGQMEAAKTDLGVPRAIWPRRAAIATAAVAATVAAMAVLRPRIGVSPTTMAPAARMESSKTSSPPVGAAALPARPTVIKSPPERDNGDDRSAVLPQARPATVPAVAARPVVEPKREISAASDVDSPVVKGVSHTHKSGSNSNAAKLARVDKTGSLTIAPPRRPKKVAVKPARNEDL